MSSIHLIASAVAGLVLAAGAADALADRKEKVPTTALVWETRGQPEALGAGLSVATDDDRVVAVGNVCTTTDSASTCNWFVRAHDARTGGILWEDRQNPGRFDRSQSVVIEGGRVFASGWYQLPLAAGKGSIDFVVRAYDLRRGTFLWEQHIDRGRTDYAEQITVKDGRVFAVGRVRGATATSDYTIFAFDAATGAELWESVEDFALIDIAFAVVADEGAVYSTGPIRNFTAMLVSARDARTGRLLWQDEIANGQMVSSTRRLVAKGDRLYVGGGILDAAGREDLLVRAYDARTGAVRWTLQMDGGGNDEALALALEGNRLFAVGSDGCDDSFISCFFSVRALDAKSGTVLWTDRFQAAAGADANAASVVVHGNVLLAGGNAQGADGTYQWAMRAYDASSGAASKAEFIGDGQLNALAAGEDLFYATGITGGAFTVRGYRVKKSGD